MCNLGSCHGVGGDGRIWIVAGEIATGCAGRRAGVALEGHLVASGAETVVPGGTPVQGGDVTYSLQADATIGRTVYQVETFNSAGAKVDVEFSFVVF